MVSVDGDEPVQMTVYQLLNGYPEGAGLRLIGQSVLETMWGNIVCDVYSLEAQYETYYYIGASDGVNYMTEYMVGGTSTRCTWKAPRRSSETHSGGSGPSPKPFRF